MKDPRIFLLVLLIVLVLAVEGCRGREQGPDRGVNDDHSITPARLSTQSPLKSHVVRGRFEQGPGDRQLTFVFEVSQAPQAPPSVRWVGTATGDDVRMLAVHTDPNGRYSALLTNVAPGAEGQLLIELSYPGTNSIEIHSADFALREPFADRASARPSRDGHFVVFTKPEGGSQGRRMLIGSSEPPIEDLPPGVASAAIVGVYSVDFLPASDSVGVSQLTLTVGATSVNPVLFYLAKGGAVWKVTDTISIEGRSMLNAGFSGPGTYMLVTEVTR